MAERKALVDMVVRATALASPRDGPCLFELAQDPLHGSLRDANRLCDLADSNVRVACDAQQYMPVITQESPCWSRLVRDGHRTAVSIYIKHKSRIDKQEKNNMLQIS